MVKKRALVTGGSGEIGSAICERLAAEGYRDHSRSSRETLHAKLAYQFNDATRLSLVASTLDQVAEDPQWTR